MSYHFILKRKKKQHAANGSETRVSESALSGFIRRITQLSLTISSILRFIQHMFRSDRICPVQSVDSAHRRARKLRYQPSIATNAALDVAFTEIVAPAGKFY